MTAGLSAFRAVKPEVFHPTVKVCDIQRTRRHRHAPKPIRVHHKLLITERVNWRSRATLSIRLNDRNVQWLKLKIIEVSPLRQDFDEPRRVFFDRRDADRRGTAEKSSV